MCVQDRDNLCTGTLLELDDLPDRESLSIQDRNIGGR